MNLAASLRSVMLGLAFFLMLLSWLLPSHYRPWVTAYQEMLAGMALVLAGGVVLLCRDNRLPLASILIGCLAGIPALQFGTGILGLVGDVWVSASYILALAFAILVGYNLQLAGQGQLGAVFAERIAWTLLLGAVVSTVLAVMQWLGFTNSVWVSSIQNPARPFANLAQPNNLATLVGMGLMSLLYLFELRKIPRLPTALLALALIFTVALTQSRTPWLTALFVVGFWLWQRRHLTLRVDGRAMLLWLLIYIAMIVSVPLLTQYLGIGSGSLMDRVQQAARLSMYKQFINALLEGPWYGYGWNQVFVAQAAVALQQVDHGPSFYTHNVLLDLLIWNGPVVGCLIILVTGIWLGYLLKNSRSLTSTYAWLALSCFLVHGMLEFPHAYLLLLIPAGLLLGILQASVASDGRAYPLPRSVTGCVCVIAALLTAVMWRDYRLIEAEYNKAVLEQHEEFVPREQQDISDVYALTHMRQYIYFIRAPLKTDYSEQQLDEMLAITHRFPHFYFLLKSAYVLAINSHIDEAYELLLLMKGLHRTPGLEQSLGYLLEKSEEHPDLLKLLERFDVRPDYG